MIFLLKAAAACVVLLGIVSVSYGLMYYRAAAVNFLAERERIKAEQQLDEAALHLAVARASQVEADRRITEDLNKDYRNDLSSLSNTLNLSKTSNFTDLDALYRRYVAKFDLQKTMHPESLNATNLGPIVADFGMMSTLLSMQTTPHPETALMVARSGLDATLLGLEKSPDDVEFARNAVFFAWRADMILADEDTNAANDILSRARRAAELAISSPAAEFQDFWAAAQLFRALARQDESAGRRTDALGDWQHCLSTVEGARKLGGYHKAQLKTLDEIADEARRKVPPAGTSARPFPSGAPAA